MHLPAESPEPHVLQLGTSQAGRHTPCSLSRKWPATQVVQLAEPSQVAHEGWQAAQSPPVTSMFCTKNLGAHRSQPPGMPPPSSAHTRQAGWGASPAQQRGVLSAGAASP